jgi:hypothetical protein
MEQHITLMTYLPSKTQASWRTWTDHDLQIVNLAACPSLHQNRFRSVGTMDIDATLQQRVQTYLTTPQVQVHGRRVERFPW